MIIEADEYQNKFTYYSPQALILTAIDWDHPDYFLLPKRIKMYLRILFRVPPHGIVVACGDDKNVNKAMLPRMRRYCAMGGMQLKRLRPYFCMSIKGKQCLQLP